MPLISPHTETSKELGHLPKFVKILYQLLQQEDHSEYLTWSQDGRGVIIQNPTEFAERLLPTYFKHCNYSSFVRQLNLYNFRKKKNGAYENVFVNPMFMKDRTDLLKNIKRKTANPIQNTSIYNDCETSPFFEKTEYDKLIEERIQESMAERIHALEQTVKKLTNDNQNTQQLCMKKKQDEEILKKAIAKVAKVFGTKIVNEITESAVSSQPGGDGSALKNSYSSPLYMAGEFDDLFLHHKESDIPTPAYAKTISSASTNIECQQNPYMSLRLDQGRESLANAFHCADIVTKFSFRSIVLSTSLTHRNF